MPNRLAGEPSLYLQQHARNPVDWFPWGDEAFDKARSETKPIFLSVGYSACHWCHVMEHESFEDESIAEFLNTHFVAIKVDREERPEIDAIYMSAVMALTGGGGWPMSVFLKPDGKPFFGGTYWPPQSRMGMPGFADILRRVEEVWRTRRDVLDQNAEELTAAVAKNASHLTQTDAVLSESLLQGAMNSLIQTADREHGGFGQAPKFPHAMDIRVLLRAGTQSARSEAIEVATHTLDCMAQGGIHDHLGGGFHRYSTDRIWLVPHFEKMLYDQALLVPAYVEAWQITGHDRFARVVRETCDYVLREMTSPGGGFYSTQDADSEGEEGRFFVWSQAEVQSILDDLSDEFCSFFDVSAGGNWEGNNILNTSAQSPESSLSKPLLEAKKLLFEVREQRVKPGRDEKVLASWNGMMIAAMSLAGRVLGEEKYIAAAERAAEFIATRMSESGVLTHAFSDGSDKRIPATLEDYAAMIDGLCELAQATSAGDVVESSLRAAVTFAEQIRDRFGDSERGGFFRTAHDHEQLIARDRDTQDSATPSGNALAATGLLKLSALTGQTEWATLAEQTLQTLSGQMDRYPMASGQSLIALSLLLGDGRQLVLAESDGTTWSAMRARFQPDAVVLRAMDPPPAILESLLAGKRAIDGRPTLYVCRRGVCESPIHGQKEILAAVTS